MAHLELKCDTILFKPIYMANLLAHYICWTTHNLSYLKRPRSGPIGCVYAIS